MYMLHPINQYFAKRNSPFKASLFAERKFTNTSSDLFRATENCVRVHDRRKPNQESHRPNHERLRGVKKVEGNYLRLLLQIKLNKYIFNKS
jgi:hypothetical protein